MSKKSKLLDLYATINRIADEEQHEELKNAAIKFHEEISAMDEEQEEEDDDNGGGNHPTGPIGKP